MSNLQLINNLQRTRYSQYKSFNVYNGQNTINDVNNFINMATNTRNNLFLGRTGYGGSAYKTTDGQVPTIEWPIPLISLSTLRCTSQNRRFQNPELVPIPRYINRRAFGNYVINNNSTGKNYPQLFTANSYEKLQLPQEPVTPTELGSLTPFRKAFNAGDPFNRFNVYPSEQIYINKNGYAKGITPANQVQGSRRASNQAAASTAGSGRKLQYNGSAYSGNTKWVYDGSDYVTYLKLKAQNNNYNDPSYGGDRHYSAQSVLARVRH